MRNARLEAIAKIASGQVDAEGMAEMDLADAESRLNRIHDLAGPSPVKVHGGMREYL
jgi:hypothetical protein